MKGNIVVEWSYWFWAIRNWLKAFACVCFESIRVQGMYVTASVCRVGNGVRGLVFVWIQSKINLVLRKRLMLCYGCIKWLNIAGIYLWKVNWGEWLTCAINHKLVSENILTMFSSQRWCAHKQQEFHMYMQSRFDQKLHLIKVSFQCKYWLMRIASFFLSMWRTINYQDLFW